MAQRTGAKRFLAPIAKTASAGVILALAVAALLLGGCGGGSSDPESSSATASSSGSSSARSTASSKDPASASQGEGKSAAKSSGGGKGTEGDPGSRAPGSPSAEQGQKHGPAIARPTGPREQAPSPSEVAHATIADVNLRSPAILAQGGNLGHLAPTYTCDGKDIWPALEWEGIPDGAAELVLFVMNLQPVEGKIFFDWALAGLDPALSEIQAGSLPSAAVVGTNSFGKRGYEICPPGSGEAYMFALYALPHSLSPKKGFDAAQLREEILAQAGNVGLLPAVYGRG